MDGGETSTTQFTFLDNSDKNLVSIYEVPVAPDTKQALCALPFFLIDLKTFSQQLHPPNRQILDDNGRVLEFVSPAPGLNLHRYLKKRVGIFGYQSYLPSLKTPHITVYRIVDLARHE